MMKISVAVLLLVGKARFLARKKHAHAVGVHSLIDPPCPPKVRGHSVIRARHARFVQIPAPGEVFTDGSDGFTQCTRSLSFLHVSHTMHDQTTTTSTILGCFLPRLDHSTCCFIFFVSTRKNTGCVCVREQRCLLWFACRTLCACTTAPVQPHQR